MGNIFDFLFRFIFNGTYNILIINILTISYKLSENARKLY